MEGTEKPIKEPRPPRPKKEKAPPSEPDPGLIRTRPDLQKQLQHDEPENQLEIEKLAEHEATHQSQLERWAREILSEGSSTVETMSVQEENDLEASSQAQAEVDLEARMELEKKEQEEEAGKELENQRRREADRLEAQHQEQLQRHAKQLEQEKNLEHQRKMQDGLEILRLQEAAREKQSKAAPVPGERIALVWRGPGIRDLRPGTIKVVGLQSIIVQADNHTTSERFDAHLGRSQNPGNTWEIDKLYFEAARRKA